MYSFTVFKTTELLAMRSAIKSHIKLSPLDTSKDVVIWKDAAPTIGMAYVNIVSCDSTTFQRGKWFYSPFEAELAALHWCINKEDYFTKGVRRIPANCDTKSRRAFLEMDLDKMDNPRNG